MIRISTERMEIKHTHTHARADTSTHSRARAHTHTRTHAHTYTHARARRLPNSLRSPTAISYDPFVMNTETHVGLTGGHATRTRQRQHCCSQLPTVFFNNHDTKWAICDCISIRCCSSDRSGISNLICTRLAGVQIDDKFDVDGNVVHINNGACWLPTDQSTIQ